MKYIGDLSRLSVQHKAILGDTTAEQSEYNPFFLINIKNTQQGR